MRSKRLTLILVLILGILPQCDIMTTPCGLFPALCELLGIDDDGGVLGFSGDVDTDGIENATDDCPFTENADQTDADADGLGDECDDCPNDDNQDQADTNGDGVGDACIP